MDISLANLSNLQNKVVTTAYKIVLSNTKTNGKALCIATRCSFESPSQLESVRSLTTGKTFLIKLCQKRNPSLFFFLFTLHTSNPKDFIFVVNLSHFVLVD